MAYDPNPSPALQWGDPNNRADFQIASPGQWFLGVLDTNTRRVYLVPSDREPDDAIQRNMQATPGVYVSAPQALVPNDGWQSDALGGFQNDRGINSHPNGHQQGGLRQHGRVVTSYGCNEDECLGFAVIKMTHHFGEFRDRSNSLNSTPHKLEGEPRLSPSGRSFRMPQGWSDQLKQWLEVNLAMRLQQSVMP